MSGKHQRLKCSCKKCDSSCPQKGLSGLFECTAKDVSHTQTHATIPTGKQAPLYFSKITFNFEHGNNFLKKRLVIYLINLTITLVTNFIPRSPYPSLFIPTISSLLRGNTSPNVQEKLLHIKQSSTT